ISGTTATDDDGRLVASGDIAGQARHIFSKFERLLKAAGAGFEHVVQTTDYITTTENYHRTADVRREFFKGRYPTATGVIVKGLLREGALIEISAMAVLPSYRDNVRRHTCSEGAGPDLLSCRRVSHPAHSHSLLGSAQREAHPRTPSAFDVPRLARNSSHYEGHVPGSEGGRRPQDRRVGQG